MTGALLPVAGEDDCTLVSQVLSDALVRHTQGGTEDWRNGGITVHVMSCGGGVWWVYGGGWWW